jgi:hypothetical protein
MLTDVLEAAEDHLLIAGTDGEQVLHRSRLRTHMS